MAYVSLYRKYRSQTFGDLIGQDHVVKTLQNGIRSGRIAHSYLFTGPRGTGKTSTARLLAKALCCEKGPTAEPDNECAICKSITAGNCIDVLEIDAASESGVDDVREQIVETIEYQPMMCRYKVFIIDEVHDLSAKAFDALLKTIEEPPAHVIFILATTEFNKVPPTIRSRCQKFDFHRASIGELVGRLNYVVESEGFEAEPAAIAAIARMADGGYRDALTLLEQAILTCEGKITLQQVYDQLGLVSEEVVDAVLLAVKDSDVPRIMEVLGEIARLGRDPRSVVESLLYRLQDLTRAIYQVESGTTDPTRDATLHETAVRLGRDNILHLRADLAEAHKTIRDISIPRLWLESELVRLSLPKPVAPVQQAAVPAVHTPAAAQRRAPTSEPVREATPIAKPPADAADQKPVPRPRVSTGGGSEIDRYWAYVLEKVAGSMMDRKLSEATPRELLGTELVVALTREMDMDWIQANPARAGHIQKLLREASGRELSVKFLVAKPESTATAPVAVELPAEGQRLEQLAKEIFGNG